MKLQFFLVVVYYYFLKEKKAASVLFYEFFLIKLQICASSIFVSCKIFQLVKFSALKRQFNWDKHGSVSNHQLEVPTRNPTIDFVQRQLNLTSETENFIMIFASRLEKHAIAESIPRKSLSALENS